MILIEYFSVYSFYSCRWWERLRPLKAADDEDIEDNVEEPMRQKKKRSQNLCLLCGVVRRLKIHIFSASLTNYMSYNLWFVHKCLKMLQRIEKEKSWDDKIRLKMKSCSNMLVLFLWTWLRKQERRPLFEPEHCIFEFCRYFERHTQNRKCSLKVLQYVASKLKHLRM